MAIWHVCIRVKKTASIRLNDTPNNQLFCPFIIDYIAISDNEDKTFNSDELVFKKGDVIHVEKCYIGKP